MAGLIRRADEADLTDIAALARRCFPDAWSAAALRSALCQKSARAWLACEAVEAGARPVAFVLARRILDGLEIDLVGVEPAARRRGFARDLLVRLLEDEAAAGLVEARLELSSQNAAAAVLYDRLGFVVVGRRARYYPDGSDALLLSRAFD